MASEAENFEECGPTSRLRTGIDIKKMLEDKEVLFEVNNDSAFMGEDVTSNYFDKNLVENEFLNDGTSLGIFDSDSETSESEDFPPFERLSRKMHDITAGKNLVLKKVKQEGHGDVPPENSTVRIHYSQTLEYNDCPFDSTFARDRPHQFRLNDGTAIIGLDIAASTMRRNEVSYFLVKPKYAYGELGCAPRIPPKSTILFKVKLLDVINDGDAAKYRNTNVEEREKFSFNQICKACEAEKESGNHYFKLNMYRKALANYKRALNMLGNFRLKDEEEENIYYKLMVKYSLNTALCHLKLGKAAPAISLCREALKIDEHNAKALFRLGKAYKMFQEYPKAIKCLKAALKIEPNNVEIVEEIKSVTRQQLDIEHLEKSMCKKMFINSTLQEEPDKEEPKNEIRISEEFKVYLAKKLDEIKENGEIKEIKLPGNLTSEEISFVKKIAEKIGLKMRTYNDAGRMITQIYKNEA